MEDNVIIGTLDPVTGKIIKTTTIDELREYTPPIINYVNTGSPRGVFQYNNTKHALGFYVVDKVSSKYL